MALLLRYKSKIGCTRSIVSLSYLSVHLKSYNTLDHSLILSKFLLGVSCRDFFFNRGLKLAGAHVHLLRLQFKVDLLICLHCMIHLFAPLLKECKARAFAAFLSALRVEVIC